MKNPIKAAQLWAARLRYNPHRESQAFPKILGLFGRSNRFLGTGDKPSPTNLRAFSRTPYARRAINAVKNPIAALKWKLVVDGESSNLKRLADTLQACLMQPNYSDSFRSMLEQIVEDALVTGAGILEQQISGDKNRPLWLWPVDATTITPVAAWDGKPTSIRFIQSTGYAQGSMLGEIDAKKLEARKIVYMRVNPSSESPYGFGPLEIAYNSIQRQLGVGQYAANLASNAQPQNLLYAGDVNPDDLLAFRHYWTNEVEGRGLTPIIGGKVSPEVHKLHPGGDEALYLKWQEFLIREIATAFNISAMNLNLEADINRNTAEVAEDRDWDSAIVPLARTIESHINRDILQGRFGAVGITFEFVGLDREDEEAAASNYKTLYESNCTTPNAYRAERGLPPLDSPWGDLCFADVQIAIKAAQGAQQVDDPELKPNPGSGIGGAVAKPRASSNPKPPKEAK